MRPTWLRVNPSIRSFILGEVERQGHPIGTREFSSRVEQMTDAWQWAMESKNERPTMDDMLHVAYLIEPKMNHSGFRRTGVWIAGREGADWTVVPHMVADLWTHVNQVEPIQGRTGGMHTADDFYLEFEIIHPFGDGNGRTGKLIHNWILGRLDDPVLVTDYFGHGNN